MRSDRLRVGLSLAFLVRVSSACLPRVPSALLSVDPVVLGENLRVYFLEIVVFVRLSMLELSKKADILDRRRSL